MEASHLHLLRTTTLLILIPLGANAQPEGFNYDEAKVPEYTLPDPLVRANGKPVSDAAAWYTERRPEILELFETHVYGRAPEPPDQMGFEIVSIDKQALGGKAVRKQITIQFSGDKEGPKMDLLLYLLTDEQIKWSRNTSHETRVTGRPCPLSLGPRGRASRRFASADRQECLSLPFALCYIHPSPTGLQLG